MEVECPICSAKFKVPDTITVTTCPYCGTTFEVQSREKVGDHFFFPVINKDPAGLLLKFLSRQYGAPADIVGAKVESKTLYYLPVHFFYIHANLKDSTAEEVAFIGIPATNKLKWLLEDYPFPVRGKRFFDESIVKKGKYYEPEISKEEAEKMAVEKVLKQVKEEAEVSGDYFTMDKVELEVVYQGLVHYPIWEIFYVYEGKKFLGYVDGSTGVVINATYPLTQEARKKAGALGAGIIGAGVLFGLIFGKLAGMWGFFSGLIPGIAGAWVILFSGTRAEREVSQLIGGHRGSIHFR
ncbi:MAG: hypothetical protein H0Z18_08900 [Thermococcus sp.]|uniref:hypothetical protein n=1 Tax=Thermococcus sp. TaxID=35749 RepID=UPI001D57E347|nr:hypothetical protein [Thermococcus sp.]MBO8175362.1 hypothetical protein [Thermococcus sp.]